MTTTPTITRAREFRDHFARAAMVADGAMGTMLYAKGVFINRCFDELNLSAPDMVREIHQEYVKAGARDSRDQYVRRRTASGWPRSGWRRSCRRSTRPAFELRAKRRKDGAFVAGAIGPLGVRHRAARAHLVRRSARAIFREQIDALLEAGVDLLILETFYNLDELREADLRRARSGRAARWSSSRKSPSTITATCRGGTDTETFTRETGRLARRRHRAELLGRTQGHARDHREA